MRVLVLVKATEDSEQGFRAGAEAKAAMAEMGKFNDELRAAGVLLDADGLKPSSQAKRVAFDGPDRKVIDGPFPHPARTGRRLLAVAGQGHGRSPGLG